MRIRAARELCGSAEGMRGWWTSRLAVEPTHRRLGVNAPACRFWDHLGYEEVPELVMFSKGLNGD